MSQRFVDWLSKNYWFRKRAPQTRNRNRSARPVAAEVLLLEDRTLLAVSLGTAESFAVLGGSAVTNTGPSVISGDLGVGPGSAVTGFPPGIVINGAMHVADAVAIQAQNDVTTAYNEIAGYTVTQVLTGQDLGGLTLTQGVYFFSSSAQLTGALTLDAQGDPNAEFYFQIGSTLTTASNSSVVMINGADPCDVFWQVGSSATLGTTTEFIGHILALTSITVQTGATLEGSVLARNGAVTLNSNVITVAECMDGSISGLKFNDLNGDGVRQPGEPGLSGMIIFLDTNNNGLLDVGESRTTSDANGSYSFTELGSGTYLVRERQQAGIVQTTPNPAPIELSDDEVVTGVNFGDFLLISISGNKFQDTNGNGVQNPGELGLAGFTIFLDADNDGLLDIGERRTTSDANGNYTFTNVGPGTYRVREVQRSGFIQTTLNPPAIIARSGTNIAGVAFGNQSVSIGGTKFQDTNGNGVRDVSEPGLQGFTIYIDADSDGVLDIGEARTTTGANGNFGFSNLPPGTYRVREVGQINFVQMTNDPADIVLTINGGRTSTVLFGNIPVANLAAVSKLLFTGRNLTNLLNGTFGRQANFVANLYQNSTLDRAPTLNELTYYLRLLMAGYTQAQITAMFRVNYRL